MSDTRSRSEIEAALSGEQRLSKRHTAKNKASINHEFDSNTPRRQQVIGGDLTGVSRRRHRDGLLSKLSNVNLTNWLAGIVVLSILIAFFWPNSSSQNIREIANSDIAAQTENFYTESRIDDPQQNAPESTSFSRVNDVNRAEDYRNQEQTQQQIEELLISAKQHIAKGEYTRPNDDNAISNYRAILAIDQSNTDAKDGINKIQSRFLNVGRNALNNNNETQAIALLNTLSTIEKESSEHRQLAQEISLWRKTTDIANLLKQAETANDDENYILPADESSLYYYRQVLALDSENVNAKQGVKAITDIYVSQANKALLDGDLEKATAYLASASVVEPNNPSIDIIRNMIATAEPIAAQTEVNRQQSSNVNPVEVAITRPASQQSPQITNTTREISDSKTPQQQASEQAEFDEIYLSQGLNAYYQGEYDKAAALLQPLADKGVSRAQFRIGYMYYLGRGFSKNSTEADKILRAALPAIQKFANEGRSWAQSDLGSLYEDGLVLPRNYPEALFWYRSAAQQGYPGAQTNLGIMYARGLGVTTSRSTAVEWFQRAAAQGDIAAQRNLESLGVN